MIEFERVGLDYAREGIGRSGRPALEDVSFSLPGGSFTFLTGHSGAGKSSLLRLVARLERPSTGTIRVGGVDYAALAPRQEPALRRQMGIVFQDNRLLADRDVFDNVALPLIIGGYAWNDIRLRVGAALEKVGLAERADARPETLSGGRAAARRHRPSRRRAAPPAARRRADRQPRPGDQHRHPRAVAALQRLGG